MQLSPVTVALVPDTVIVPEPVTVYVNVDGIPVLGASQSSDTEVAPVAEPVRFCTAPGSSHVVTLSEVAGPVPAALLAATENA